MSVPIAPLVELGLKFLLGFMKIAVESKELSKLDYEVLKKKIDENFEEFAKKTWEDYKK